MKFHDGYVSLPPTRRSHLPRHNSEYFAEVFSLSLPRLRLDLAVFSPMKDVIQYKYRFLKLTAHTLIHKACNGVSKHSLWSGLRADFGRSLLPQIAEGSLSLTPWPEEAAYYW